MSCDVFDRATTSFRLDRWIIVSRIWPSCFLYYSPMSSTRKRKWSTLCNRAWNVTLYFGSLARLWRNRQRRKVFGLESRYTNRQGLDRCCCPLEGEGNILRSNVYFLLPICWLMWKHHNNVIFNRVAVTPALLEVLQGRSQHMDSPSAAKLLEVQVTNGIFKIP